MSAGLLRTAAALMRERAEAATPSAWCEKHPSGAYGVAGEARGLNVVHHDSLADKVVAHVDPWGGSADAEHIASWHPAVALAVADLLDAAARVMGDNDFLAADGSVFEHLVAVARAYLGSES